ncbi:MAG: UDP-N-acetylglucosamine--N-acetylmuramyl-(pentapeptide) pyrophosphoryl-undecaprenol N-acetylglucosamine transferase [Phycisphaerales bacterium]|nr:UDP-N-acetylglucosamine--N-acetylmuramyl-(pentapeptide) pyrophosphoryl-undecaprenol N-acetylglucosamine transferase [Phycisphaerales bacterium]
MDQARTIIFAGGGTGGHLYPGVSVAQALREKQPQIKVLFLCTQREIDSVILKAADLPFIAQPIIPPVRTIGGLLKFWESWRLTKDLVKHVFRDHQPAAVLGLGGYAAGVAVKLAGQKKIPAALVNPDVLPGKANQYLMRYVQAVCCQFEQTRQHVSSSQQSKLHMTGCPIRASLRNLPGREQALDRLELSRRLNTLVVAGGSQGAQTISQAVLQALKEVRMQGWQVLHLSGRDHAEEVRAGYRELDVPARVIDFTPDMADIYAAADLMINRSGASGCAEITACGVPAILMPYPFHKDMHQRANARALAEAGAAIVLDDARDRRANAAALKPLLESLLHDADRRQQMADHARRIAKPEAAQQVAQLLIDMMK